MAVKLGVSIVAMNRPDTLRQTIAELVRTLPVEIPVVLVDNGSDPILTRETVGIPVTEQWHVLRNHGNLGLSRAVNQGLAALYELGCDVLIHLDDDALIAGPDRWPVELDEIFTDHAEIGLCLPNQDWYTEFIPRQDYHELRWGLGFAWALRSKTYERIGGYDPQLLHQQECDLALRVRMADYTVGAVRIGVTHNDPGRPAPDESWRQKGTLPTLGQAREHLGVVQFRTKWCEYFRGRGWSYGSIPLYLMQHWPPDQEWYGRFLRANGVELNPDCPEARLDLSPGQVLGVTAGNVSTLPRRLQVAGQPYTLFVELRSDITHWYRGDGYESDRQLAIENWFKLTGEKYEGYRWPNLLRPKANG